MAKRIVQLLVTVAVDTNETRAHTRDEVEQALAAELMKATVEIVESRTFASLSNRKYR
jgi:hypothetical protein